VRRSDRRSLYRLLGGLLQECPSTALLDVLGTGPTLENLAERIGGAIGEGLGRMRADVGGCEGRHPALRQEYVRLFVGPGKKLAPPWESVYRGPERLVMQEPHAQVLRAYAEQKVGFDGFGKRPADHVALEMQFVSTLLARSRAGSRADAALRRFLDEHLLAWLPAFAGDVRRHAKTEFWQGVGETLTALCEAEAARPRA